ncbi:MULTISPECIES: hypothetical protein [Gordonia]|nr:MULTISPECIES: hypothetical protein [Gordonia]WFN92527.1 hypothetical protein P5P27_17440 [Gordonia sihwensis]
MTSMESVRPSVAAVHDRVTVHLDALDDATLVDQLRTLLGARLVAYLAGAPSTAAVSDYITHAAAVPDHVRARLKVAYSVAALQHQLGATPSLIQAWFQGRNPRLDDRAPAQVIADDPGRFRGTLIAAAVTLVGG